MAVTMTTNTEYLNRTSLWSREVTDLLLDDLFAMRFVRTLTDFPDGTTLNIPSIGEAEVFNYAEGQAIKYNNLDTGNFQFEIDQYVGSANAVTEQFKQDSFYANEMISLFSPRQHRAIMEHYETRVWNRLNAGQTASNLNTINDADHRWMASGSSNVLNFDDFFKARYALKKANVPLRNLVAIVDPSTAYKLETQANMTNLMTPQGNWSESLLKGLASGFQYRFTIGGFDVFESNYLPRGSTLTDTTIDGVSIPSAPVANFFFSAEPGQTLPLVGAWRQMPTVYSEFNKDLQQTEYLTVCRYGVKCMRPDNLVTVISNYDVV